MFVNIFVPTDTEILYNTGMGRKQEFDYEEALDRATHLFWSKGYTNTSLRDLLKVMDIGQSSFYNLVENKSELYLRCLVHYNKTITEKRWKTLTESTSIQVGIRNFFKAILDELSDEKKPSICLMAGSLASDVLSDPKLSEYILHEMSFLENEFVKQIKIAKDKKDLPKYFNEETSAAIIITFLQGFFRVFPTLKNRKEIEDQIETLLTGLGL